MLLDFVMNYVEFNCVASFLIYIVGCPELGLQGGWPRSKKTTTPHFVSVTQAMKQTMKKSTQSEIMNISMVTNFQRIVTVLSRAVLSCFIKPIFVLTTV